ncbi:magnesium/cobalt transporter CorA [Desulfonema limicola]|nr:magnesium/cobalt transporter CorA [Desulfonema limicola]
MFLLNHSPDKTGMSPGTLIHTGERKAENVHVSSILYNETLFEEKEIIAEQCLLKQDNSILWIHIKGLHNPDIINSIGQSFSIHNLVLEDILNTAQRPKIEEYDECLFVVLKSFRTDKDSDKILTEQISIIMGENFVISFQESSDEIFNQVRKRLENKTGRIRKMKSDYLAYALMDTVIDHYFSVIESLENQVETIEDTLIKDPSVQALENIYYLKQEVLFMRKAVKPVRDMIYKLERMESGFINDTTRIFIRDLYDHSIQTTDSLETLREITSSLLDLYHTSVSSRMNEVMKVLTIISTIFIPLSFIAGVYGMNFKYMPELEFKWGYLIVWILIVSTSLSMLTFFRKRKWI